MANYNSYFHPENDTGSVVFPNINGQSIPENAITPSKVAAGQFPQIVAGSVQNPLTIVTAEGQTEYDGSDAATIDISSIQDADHAYTADRATADDEGNNIPATYAKQNGTYGSLISGGIQCIPLNENADLNECVPENTSVFQVWVCIGSALSNTYANTPYQNFNRTFYLTAIKTWYDSSDTSRYRVNQTLYSITSGGDSLIWTRCIDGAGTAGWSAWKELVTSDGEYETLGAGYLSRYGFVNASAQAWYKIATVDIAQAGIQYNSYSAKILVNGVNATQQYTYPNKSGTLELDVRYNAGTIVSDQTGLSISSGNIDTDDYCVTIDGTIVTLYAHMPYQYAQTTFTVAQESYENTPIAELLNFNIQNVGTSAPSGAVYAAVRNGADHLVLPAAVGSATTPVYFDANGVPKPCTLPVSKYYNHTFMYQPSKLVQTSDFSFIFSVVLDVETPIPAGNTVLWGTYLNLPQTSLAPMPSNSKFFPATGIIKQDGQVGRIMGVALAAQPLGVNLIASIYYEYNGTTGVYPASNSHVVLDPDRISESVVTP